MSGAMAALRAHLAEPLNRTSLSLVSSMALTAVMGVGFWAVAARMYAPATVGRDSALIAALTAIASLCQLNLTNVIVRFLPQIHKRLGLRVLQGYVAAALASIVVASAFVFLAPLASHQFTFLRSDAFLAVGFVLSTTAWTVFSLQDSVLTALRRAAWVPVENGLFSAAKLALLPLGLAVFGGLGIFAAWVVPMFVAIAVVNWLIARRVMPAAALAQRGATGVVDVFGWRPLLSFLAADFLGSAIGQIVMTALPLLVIGLLGTTAQAYFYVPFTLIVTFDLMFGAVATSLTAEAARAPERIGEFMAMVRRRFLFLQVPMALGLVVAAPVVLELFGPAYVRHSTDGAAAAGAGQLLSGLHRDLRGHGPSAREGHRDCSSCSFRASFCSPAGRRSRPRTAAVTGVALAWLVTAMVVAGLVAPSVARFARAPRLAGRKEQLCDRDSCPRRHRPRPRADQWPAADRSVSSYGRDPDRPAWTSSAGLSVCAAVAE